MFLALLLPLNEMPPSAPVPPMPRLDTGAHQAKRAEHPSSGDHCVLVPTVIASSLGDVPDGDSEIVESSELHTQSPTHGTPAVARARPIEDISRVSYPEGIRHPKAELNVGACRGKYRYDVCVFQKIGMD